MERPDVIPRGEFKSVDDLFDLLTLIQNVLRKTHLFLENEFPLGYPVKSEIEAILFRS